jgi:hypothetical protein
MEEGANQYGAAAVASDARLADWRKVRRVVFEDIRFIVGVGRRIVEVPKYLEAGPLIYHDLAVESTKSAESVSS